jgi:hypothetical protein
MYFNINERSVSKHESTHITNVIYGMDDDGALLEKHIRRKLYAPFQRSRWASSLVSATILDGRKLPSLRTSARVEILYAHILWL